jgi:hypothetical protein
MPFTPSNSEQRLPPTCYRGCWHVVSRGLFVGSCHPTGIPSHGYSSPTKGLYNLSAFVIHAASLRQTFVHCGIFLAAASRRSLGRISVPVWAYTLSGRLPIIALVGRYLTNKLMGRGLILGQRRSAFPRQAYPDERIRYYPLFLMAIPNPRADHPRVTHQSAALGGIAPPCRTTCMLKTRRQRSF